MKEGRNESSELMKSTYERVTEKRILTAYPCYDTVASLCKNRFETIEFLLERGICKYGCWKNDASTSRQDAKDAPSLRGTIIRVSALLWFFVGRDDDEDMH